MRKIKYFILILVIFGGLGFLFGPEVIPENFQPQEVLNIASNSDVIIIFNSGGWGDTPIDQAEDFAPLVEGMRLTLKDLGYNSVVIPYNRTRDNFLGRIAGAREFFNSFKNSSKDLAKEIEFLREKLPDKKIIITGLSNGASFVNETYEKISGEVKDSVYTIAVGTPFWTVPAESDNILQVDNKGKDDLVKGNVFSLLSSLIKTPFNRGFKASGHEYFWSSPEVSSQIVSFLEDKLR